MPGKIHAPVRDLLKRMRAYRTNTIYTICPRSSDPIYIVNYNIK